MSNLKQAAELALEALRNLQGGCTDHDDGTVEAITVWCPEVIEALEQALAEPEPSHQLPIEEALKQAYYYTESGEWRGSETPEWERWHAVAKVAVAEPEPVTLPCCGYTNASAVKWNPHNQVVQCHNCGQVYTAPTPRKPLTDEQLLGALVAVDPETKRLPPGFRAFARAIEAAHGIKEQEHE